MALSGLHIEVDLAQQGQLQIKANSELTPVALTMLFLDIAKGFAVKAMQAEMIDGASQPKTPQLVIPQLVPPTALRK